MGVGEVGPAEGTVATASPGGLRRGAGRAGVRPVAAAPESARVPAGQWRPGRHWRVRRERAVEAGGLGRPRRLPGPQRRAGEAERRVRASDLGKRSLRPGVAGRTGKPRQRWRSRGQPQGSGAVPLGPLATSASGRATWCRLRGGARLPVSAPVRGKSRSRLSRLGRGSHCAGGRLGSRVPCP